MHRFKLTSIFLLCLAALPAYADISVTTTFSPPRIAMGDRSQYIVAIVETDNRSKPEVERITSLPIPQSGGLQLSNGRTSTSQQTSILNGVAEYSVTQRIIIDAKPPNTGSFTIPTFVFQYKGETYRAPAATLQVVERPADAGPTADELIFVRTDAPAQLYVGQTTSIQLKLYISENLRRPNLNDFERSADGFTISELPESRQSSEIINGQRYRVFTWPLTITPIQTGEQDLSFQFVVSASVARQSNRRDPFGSRSFGGSILDDFFGSPERFNVYNEPTTIEVLPLPTAEQPDSFTGAIGDFGMQVYTDREETQAGEPIMLSVEINGTGNFDRINGPAIPTTNQWRSYDPESNFQPRSPDNTLRGSKRFDYVMIPQNAGTLEIPGISFAFFDPETERYITLNSPPIPIKVNASDQPISSVAPSLPAPAAPKADALPLQKELSMEEALLTLDYRPQVNERIGTAPLKDARFWIANGLAAAALAYICFFLARKRRLSEDAAYARQLTAKKDFQKASKEAQHAADADHFYAAAQKSLRLATTCRTRTNLRNADVDELTNAMQRDGITEETIRQTREFFNLADAHRFAGKATRSDLTSSKAQLERILKAI